MVTTIVDAKGAIVAKFDYALSTFESAIVSRVIKFLTREVKHEEEERFCQYVDDWCTEEQRRAICATLRRVLKRLEWRK
jgi:hypothetical protein